MINIYNHDPKNQRVKRLCSYLIFLPRNISGSLLRVDPNIPDLGNNTTAVNERNNTGMSFCEVKHDTMIFLSLIVALVGLFGNVKVIWLLGFLMLRNALSIYLLNLSGSDFLFICFQIGYCFHILAINSIPIEISVLHCYAELSLSLWPEHPQCH